MLQEVAAKYGALSEDDGVAFRGTYLINPEGILEHITINDYGIGRNIDETTQFVAEHGEVCSPIVQSAAPKQEEKSCACNIFRSTHTSRIAGLQL